MFYLILHVHVYNIILLLILLIFIINFISESSQFKYFGSSFLNSRERETG